jgi:hypothetical protein
MTDRERSAVVALRAWRKRLAARGMIMKVMAQEVIAFSVAFALSLAISVAVVDLIWGLI